MAKDRPEGAWSGPRPFVGMSEALDELTREVDAAVESGGRAVFLLGPEGSGKTAVVGIFQEQAFRRHSKLRAQYVDCAYSGAKTWVEFSDLFTRRHRLGHIARNLSAEWLEVIPVLGKFLAAISRTIQALRTGKAPKRRERLPESEIESALGAVRNLLEYGAEEPRLLIMDSLDRGDSEDLAGASALLRALGKTRTLFLATVRTSKGEAPQPVRDLILEAERLGRARALDLPGLSIEDIRSLVNELARQEGHEALIDFLHEETRGIPGDLWSALGYLESEGHLNRRGRRWIWDGSLPQRSPSESRPSDSFEHPLSDKERTLLTIASIQGRVFHSAVLAELAEMPELEVEDILSRLRRVGVLEYLGESDVGEDVTSEYSFRQPEAVDQLASQLPSDERDDLLRRVRDVQRRLGLLAARD